MEEPATGSAATGDERAEMRRGMTKTGRAELLLLEVTAGRRIEESRLRSREPHRESRELRRRAHPLGPRCIRHCGGGCGATTVKTLGKEAIAGGGEDDREEGG
jgi:hypothetical protein